MYQRHYVFTDLTLVPVTMTLDSKNGYSATPWLDTDMFETETVFFTSISAFYQAPFCLIPIAEGSSAGTRSSGIRNALSLPTKDDYTSSH